MADVNEGDVIRVTACLVSDWEGDIQNVWHIKQTSGDISEEDFMDDCADALDTAYDYMDGVMPDSVTFDEIRAFQPHARYAVHAGCLAHLDGWYTDRR